VTGTSSGTEGGVRLNYADAARFASWTLEPAGPGVYILRAALAESRPAWLAYSPLVIWVHRGALRWEWTVDEVSVVNGRLESVLNEPRLGPKGG
jgi:hypothetical protein